LQEDIFTNVNFDWELRVSTDVLVRLEHAGFKLESSKSYRKKEEQH